MKIDTIMYGNLDDLSRGALYEIIHFYERRELDLMEKCHNLKKDIFNLELTIDNIRKALK